MADDPLQVFLDRTKLSTAQKAGLWDLYHAAKNTEDLDSRLKALDLPKEIKADLWDLKASEAIPEANAKDIPKAQTWADVLHKRAADPYGITAWEQGTGGMPMLIPAEAGAAGVELAKSAAQKGLNTLQRVAASAKSTGGEAATIAKAGGAYYATKYIGLPEPIPTIAAIIAGRSGGAGKGSAVAAEATAAEATPLGFPKPTGPVETPLEFTRRRKAEHQARTGRTKVEAPAQPAARSPLKVDPKEFATEFKKLAKTPKLTAEEMSIGAKLLQSGMKAEDVLEKLLKRREFPSSWLALPTDADLAATIGARNATGEWPQP